MSAATNRQEQYEALGDLYLSLWKQLDLLSGESKWFEVRPISQSELEQHSANALAHIRSRMQDPKMLKFVERDYSRTQTLCNDAAGTTDINQLLEGPEIEHFKTYFRDQGLRYDEAADTAEGIAAAHGAD